MYYVCFLLFALFLPVFSQTELAQSLADDEENIFSTDSLLENIEKDTAVEEITLVLQDNLKETANLPFLFRNNSLTSFSFYRQSDGENLSYKKTRALISTIPENNKLMRQERNMRVSSQIFAGLTIASLSTTIYYYNDDSPRSSDKFLNSAASLFTFSVYSVFSQIIANNKLQQGVDNYNCRVVKR